MIEEVTFSSGKAGYNFYIKNKIKSEIFKDKKVDKQICFSLEKQS